MKTLILLSLSLFLQNTNAFASAQDEVKACLRQALDKENPVFQVADESIGLKLFTRRLILICNGDNAKNLFNALNTPVTPGDWSGKTEGDVRVLGEAGGSSMCYHITRDSSGERANDYNCSINLGVSEAALGRTETSDMVPFVTKEIKKEVKETVSGSDK